jgi:hypothetical protein
MECDFECFFPKGDSLENRCVHCKFDQQGCKVADATPVAGSLMVYIKRPPAPSASVGMVCVKPVPKPSKTLPILKITPVVPKASKALAGPTPH